MPAGTITGLVVQSGDHERVNVFVDGTFAIGVSLATLERQGLYKGQVLSEADWQQLEQAEQTHKAWEAALRLLEVRPRTERELRDRLRRKQFPPQQIDEVIQRLRALDLIDDTQFARMWVANRAAIKPKGSIALRRELIGKGVDRRVADEIVDAAVDEAAEARACEEVARQALARYRSVEDWPTFQRRLGGMLLRRGFTWDMVGPLLKQLWRERDAAGGDSHDEIGSSHEPE
jgi:regulatory protein